MTTFYQAGVYMPGEDRMDRITEAQRRQDRDYVARRAAEHEAHPVDGHHC